MDERIWMKHAHCKQAAKQAAKETRRTLLPQQGRRPLRQANPALQASIASLLQAAGVVKDPRGLKEHRRGSMAADPRWADQLPALLERLEAVTLEASDETAAGGLLQWAQRVHQGATAVQAGTPPSDGLAA